MVRSTRGEDHELQDIVRHEPSALGRLLNHRGPDNGFEHTLAEILQQPATWLASETGVTGRVVEDFRIHGND